MAIPIPVGSVIAERYRVDGVLGEGGMGVVVGATHLVLQQRVAIKFLRREAIFDSGAVNRFVKEAQAAAKVQSEHIVRVQDVAILGRVDEFTRHGVAPELECRSVWRAAAALRW